MASDLKVNYFEDQIGLAPKAVSSIISNFTGRTLTLLEAAITNEQQLKSLKDMIRGFAKDSHRMTEEVCFGSQITVPGPVTAWGVTEDGVKEHRIV